MTNWTLTNARRTYARAGISAFDTPLIGGFFRDPHNNAAQLVGGTA